VSRPSIPRLVSQALPDQFGIDHLRNLDREPVVGAAIALLAGIAVYALSTGLFPYHSSNHDEAVYLQQAAMLLDGQLELAAGELAGAFRPWFFIEDGGRLYPKYNPVPAAMYAVSMGLFGEPRVTLAIVAATNAALVYLLASMVFDRQVGIVASGLFALSPLALITTSVFLPYAPTTMLNLIFAVTYLRGVRDRSLLNGAVAGVAIGLAFFARPLTALLFAIPFVLHAGLTLLRALADRELWTNPVRRNLLTAGFGLGFVILTLAYNVRLTGSPLVFPYEAFAPLDGPGFGRREMLEHSINYTPELALRANGYVLWYFVTRWFTAGVLGTLCAAGGLVLALRRWWNGTITGHRRAGGLMLAGLFVTVPLGNIPFWGNFNVLAEMTDPTDGLISQFGPIYQFDLLVPLSVFGAFALVAGWRWLRTQVLDQRLLTGVSSQAARVLTIAVLASTLLVFGVANLAVLSEPVDRNAAHTEKFDQAYEPIEQAEFDNAMVFIPTPYGDWQSHPLQYLRNEPGFDGPVVYALDREPAEDFSVVDAYPDRNYYRYSYQGEWSPEANRHVVPKLEPLSYHSGSRLDAETVVSVPARVSRATVELESGPDSTRTSIENPTETIAVDWAIDSESATLVESGESVPLDDTEELVMSITLVQPDGSTLTYRQEATVRSSESGVEVLWPPERTVCTLVTDCGSEGTYLPDNPDAHLDGVSFETRIEDS